MSRSVLMVLLALDLFVMGTSVYIVWSRVQKHRAVVIPATAAAAVPEAQPSPAVVQAQKTPAPPQPAAAPAPKEPPRDESTKTGEPRKVLFKYRDAIPARVSIVGDFNQWSPQLMQKDKNGNWTAALKLAPGEYAYNFIVDGRMIRDPSNRRQKNSGQKIPSSVIAVKHK